MIERFIVDFGEVRYGYVSCQVGNIFAEVRRRLPPETTEQFWRNLESLIDFTAPEAQ